MKKNLYILLIGTAILLSAPAFAQKSVVVVEPDEGINIGALNDAITAAPDPGNTIFELRRGGIYYLNGTISFSGFGLHIRAEDGDGPRPVLQPAVDEQGNVGRHFSSSGNLTLESLYLQGRSELESIIDQPVRVSGDDTRVIIDDCIMDYATSSMVRLNGSNTRVYISNSIIRNALLADNPDNGRLVDTRSNPTDTIKVTNSTIYNGGSRLIRTSGANINYMELNQNTVFQLSFKENFMLDATKTAKITNNIFYNFSYRVDNTQHDPMFTVDSIGEGGPYTDAERSFDLSNNNIYQQQEIIDVFNNFSPDTLYRFNDWDTEQQDTIWYTWEVNTSQLFANQNILDTAVWTPKPVLLHFIENGQVDTTNIFSEELTFDNPPPLNLEYLQFYVENNFSIGGTNPPNPYADEDPAVVGEVADGYTFGYSSDSKTAAAGSEGQPLGDPRWALTEPNSNIVKTAPRLTAYPNPGNGIFTVAFTSDSKQPTRLEVVNITGQVVYSKDTTGEGAKSETIDLQHLNKGIYFIVLRQNQSANNVKLVIQ
jgi:hypothetical protein